MDKCNKCGSDWKVVPAGVSKKTGLPYQSFTVCSNRDCDGRPTNTTPTPAQNFITDLNKMDEQAKEDKIAEGKVRHAFALEAYKAGKELDFETVTKIRNWTYFVIKDKLPNEDTPAVPPPADGDEINVDQVPF